MPESEKLEKFINLIKTGDVKFIVGIEKDGKRDFIKSEFSARIIGSFYRASLEEERPEELPSKELPFPELWEQVSIKENTTGGQPKRGLLFPDFREGMQG
jgi:hypothetical protein